MYRQDVAELTPGMVLAKTVYTDRGIPLLRAGVTLTSAFIDALQSRGQIAVYVEDGLVDDIVPTNVVSEQLRQSTTTHLAAVFSGVAAVARASADGDPPETADEALGRLGKGPLVLDKRDDPVQTLYDDIEGLLTEILDGDAVASLDSLKTHNGYTFQHSVDVAILGILLGKRLGIHRSQLRELALGCLLHDIGKTYIDTAILDKPGRLTPEEFEEVKQHPRMGFEIVRRMPIGSILPAHIAYQHHERQDGTGYPRLLRGSNRINRTTAEQYDPKRMMLFAEMAAVADVYSAVASDRPYRAAMPLHEVARLLDEMSGKHLNRDVVHLFMRTVPFFPVGYWIEITSGTYRGWRGVVSALNHRDLQRPVVRLVLDATGRDVADPVELDLAAERHVGIECLRPGDAPHDSVPSSLTA